VAGWLEDVDDYHVHPAHLDSCLQVVLANVLEDALSGEVATFLPVGLERFDYDPAAGHFRWSRAATRMIQDDGNRVVVDVEVLDDAGRPAALISGIELRRASAAALLRFEENRYREWTYEVCPLRPRSATTSWRGWIRRGRGTASRSTKCCCRSSIRSAPITSGGLCSSSTGSRSRALWAGSPSSETSSE
jgi:hypothetical protein